MSRLIVRHTYFVRARGFGACCLFLLFGCALGAAPQEAEQSVGITERSKSACAVQKHKQTDYVVCRFDPIESDIRLFLNTSEGETFAHFNKLNEALSENGERLVFAMNGGMYHADRSPVGFYVEDEIIKETANTNDGPGNFHMKPNGAFLIWSKDGDRGAAILVSEQIERQAYIGYATQSGPMLVIEGKLHPRFLPDSNSLKRRNGVGVTETGGVIFVLADTPVNFHQFAVFFRDELKTPNALYLDGTISRIYAPALGRNDPGAPMGPIIGVVAKQ